MSAIGEGSQLNSNVSAIAGDRVAVGEVGLMLPTFLQYRDSINSFDEIALFARLAEESGASCLWALDHILWPIPVFEAIDSLILAASATKNISVGTCVMQLPLRSEIIVAKQFATLGAASGRVPILGVGIGSHPREYELLGVDYKMRGERFNRQLERLIELREMNFLTTTKSNMSDDQYCFQPPFNSPIWIGGRGFKSLERAASYGDGWIPHSMSQKTYVGKIQILKEMLSQRGRDISEVKKGIAIYGNITKSSSQAAEAIAWASSLFRIDQSVLGKYVFTGSASQFAELIFSWGELGVDHIMVGIASDNPNRSMELLMDKVCSR
ncbi:MAG: LLM class flavin-dependent oxidoreductase [Acidimicrobiales bacterium]|nr:LLM class flavin-dependent oxidoreductase [Acidimicrobiales bacterium]